jgi:hypothetical protein
MRSFCLLFVPLAWIRYTRVDQRLYISRMTTVHVINVYCGYFYEVESLLLSNRDNYHG